MKQIKEFKPHKAQTKPSLQPTSSHKNIADVIKTFLSNTRCQITYTLAAFLIKLLGNKPVTLTLLYSGHLHGWESEDFHSRCDSKGRTVSLFQIEQGDCIGGYTSQHWESDWGEWKEDSSSFLFNLTRSRYFSSKASGKDIIRNGYFGPYFSGGRNDELVAFQPFNGEDNCKSCANQLGYNIPLVYRKNQLTNKANGLFTISELEVWLVE